MEAQDNRDKAFTSPFWLSIQASYTHVCCEQRAFLFRVPDFVE